MSFHNLALWCLLVCRTRAKASSDRLTMFNRLLFHKVLVTSDCVSICVASRFWSIQDLLIYLIFEIMSSGDKESKNDKVKPSASEQSSDDSQQASDVKPDNSASGNFCIIAFFHYCIHWSIYCFDYFENSLNICYFNAMLLQTFGNRWLTIQYFVMKGM